ncbi:hypothetical protein [Stetteria hydrogenophila]
MQAPTPRARRSKGRLLLLAALAVAVALPVAFLAAGGLGLAGYGRVVFVISIYDPRSGWVGLVKTVLGLPSVPSDVVVYAQIYAITPPAPGYSSPIVEVYRGAVNWGVLDLKPEGEFGRIARDWVEALKAMGRDPALEGTSVELNLWVVDKASGEVLQRVSQFYPYNPYKLLNGEMYVYRVRIPLVRP